VADLRVIITASDYFRTLAFYGDVLGLTIHESWDDPDGRGTLFRAADGMIEVFEANAHHPAHRLEGVRLGIQVDDAQALHDRVVEHGITIVESIGDRAWGHRSFTIEDPDGLPLTFFHVLR
jgi:catechol 2,3-dioxygenase-like lactoylglutathione lyase family enzyme